MALPATALKEEKPMYEDPTVDRSLSMYIKEAWGYPLLNPEEDKTFVELRTETTYQSLRIPKFEYARGEPVPFEYKAEGVPWPVLLEWWIYQGDKEIYYPYYFHTFSSITHSAANASSNVFNGSWSQKDKDSIQVPAGEYTLYVGGGQFSSDHLHLNFLIEGK